MESNKGLFDRFKHIYSAARRWIVYLDLLLIVVIFYFGSFLGRFRDALLPVVAISILAIFFETLQSLNAKVTSASAFAEFPTITEAIPKISEILQQEREKLSVEIIGATGGSIMTIIFPTILRVTEAKHLDITLRLIKPNSPFMKWFPEHWVNETQATVNRAKNYFEGRKAQISIFAYDGIPIFHAIMINKKHLFLGFFGWSKTAGGPKLRGAEQPHRYYSRNDPSSTYFFDLVENWCKFGPYKLLHSNHKDLRTQDK